MLETKFLPKAVNKEQGSVLLEGLIAILVFSMGILAIVGLQVAAIKTVADSQYRLEASFLANRLIAQMWTDTANIGNYGLPGGARAENWKNEVQGLLPGATNLPPTVNIAGDAVSGYTVTIRLNWKAAAEASGHNYTTIAYINPN